MIYRSLAETPRDFGPCAITIGNFDGVHAGHRKILRRVAALAREEGWKAAALTFDPHPAKLLSPVTAPRLLTTLDQRARMMLEQGIDQILILPFTLEVAALTPEEFVRDLLVDKLGARAVLVGANFHFGKRAAGDAGTLEEFGERYSFETDILTPVLWRNTAARRGWRRFHCLPDAEPAAFASGRGGARRRDRIEANRSHIESGYQRGSCACQRCVCDADPRRPARMAVDHEYRLSAYV
jgi:riboflavin kinase/FMN adenylyltransferase